MPFEHGLTLVMISRFGKNILPLIFNTYLVLYSAKSALIRFLSSF